MVAPYQPPVVLFADLGDFGEKIKIYRESVGIAVETDFVSSD